MVVGFGDRFRGSGGAVILGEVAAMQEEVWEDAVKEAAAVAVAFLAVAEQPEVLRRPWRHVRPQLNHDAAWVVKSVKVGDFGRGSWPASHRTLNGSSAHSELEEQPRAGKACARPARE